MENTRQQKVARQIQKYISDILHKECSGLLNGSMTTVTAVRMSPDLSYAKIYLSIVPFDRHQQVMEVLEANNWLIRKSLGNKIRNLLRIVPELAFFLEDSFEYIDKIDNLLK